MDPIICFGLFFVFYAWGVISIWTTRDYQTNDVWPFLWPSVLLGMVLYYSLPNASLYGLYIYDPSASTPWTILVVLILPFFFSFEFVVFKQTFHKAARVPAFDEEEIK